MNVELLILFALVAPLIGALATIFVPAEERRWTVVLTLLITLGAMVLSFLAESVASPRYFGPLALVADAFTLTVGPALVFSRLVLALSGGRTVAASLDSVWLLALLSVEFLALFTLSPTVLVIAELVSAAVIASRLLRRGQRPQAVYLAVGVVLLLGALPAVVGVAAFTQVPAWAGLMLVAAGLLRLGIFPLSTGHTASLSGRFDPTSLVSVLPISGVLLVLRFGPTLDALPEVAQGLLLWVKIAAPFAAAMAVAQRSLPRAFGYTLLASHALLVTLALDHSVFHVAIAGEFWAALMLSGAGFGAAAYLVTLRFGAVNLNQFSGFQRHVPRLSGLFLVLGFALAGAPGTVQFVAEDFLLNTVELDLGTTLLVVSTIALMGFSVLRMHFRVFYGRDRFKRDFMQLRRRERVGLFVVVALVVFGGLVPSFIPLVSAVRDHPGTISGQAVPGAEVHPQHH
jgi:NADH-quinone oxidoreductase subunit M